MLTLRRSKMVPVITIKVRGLKCDTPGCGWADWTIPMKDYPAWVNRPCPDCGGNLLTERSMKEVCASLIFVRLMNIAANLVLPRRVLLNSGPYKRMRMQYDRDSDRHRAGPVEDAPTPDDLAAVDVYW